MNSDDLTHAYKVILIGDSGVGKTSMFGYFDLPHCESIILLFYRIVRLIEQVFTESVFTTIGASFCKKAIQIDDKNVLLQIWDTAGQERFKALTKMYYRDTQVAILCFDVNNSTSFANIKVWYKDLKQSLLHPSPSSSTTSQALNTTTTKPTTKIITVICGTKMDLPCNDSSKLVEELPLQVKENIKNAQQFSQEIDALFFVTSSKNNSNIEEMFTTIAREIIRHQVVKTERPATGNVIQIVDDDDNNGGVGEHGKVPSRKNAKKQKSNCCNGSQTDHLN